MIRSVIALGILGFIAACATPEPPPPPAPAVETARPVQAPPPVAAAQPAATRGFYPTDRRMACLVRQHTEGDQVSADAEEGRDAALAPRA